MAIGFAAKGVGINSRHGRAISGEMLARFLETRLFGHFTADSLSASSSAGVLALMLGLRLPEAEADMIAAQSSELSVRLRACSDALKAPQRVEE